MKDFIVGKKRLIILLLGVIVCAAVVAAAFPLSAVMRKNRIDTQTKTMLSTMTVEEKIGQVLLMDFRSWGKDAEDKPIGLQECNDTVREIIQRYHVGNIILFGENTQSTEKAVRLIDDLQNAASADGGMPLLIGVDQEGGVITRLGQGTCLPGNMALGATGDAKNARTAAEIIGKELSAIGINCDFAPDSDVNDNPQNPVIHVRSFSSNPQTVAKMATAFRSGLAGEGVIAAAKHFPGHGNTSVDTHVGLAVVNKTKAEWEAVEAVPFRALIDNGVDMIMSAHIQFPQLDDTKYISKLTGEEMFLPATLSHKILTGILREKMGFDGVIVTDAMAMKAIADNFGEAEASVMALAAGADLICTPTEVRSAEDVQKLDALYEEIKLALLDGRLTMERLDEASGRVIRLKLQYDIPNQVKGQKPLEERVKEALATVGSAEHHAIERKLANAAITYHAAQPYAPMKLTEGETVLFFVPYPNKANSVRYAMDRLMQEGKIPKVNTQVYIYDDETEVTPDALAQLAAANHVIIVSQMYSGSLNQPENTDVKMPILLAQTVEAQGKTANSAVISIGLPNDADHFPGLPVYLGYGYQGMSEKDAQTGVLTGKYGPNLPAAVDCLMGVFAPTGVLPVTPVA